MQSNKVNCIAVDSASNVLVVDFVLPCAHATVHTGDHGAAGPPATRRRPVHFPPLKEVLYGVDLTEYNVAMSQGEKKFIQKLEPAITEYNYRNGARHLPHRAPLSRRV